MPGFTRTFYVRAERLRRRQLANAPPEGQRLFGGASRGELERALSRRAAHLLRAAQVAEQLGQRIADGRHVVRTDGTAVDPVPHELGRCALAAHHQGQTAGHCLEHAAASTVVALAQPDRHVEPAIGLYETRTAQTSAEADASGSQRAG